LEKETDLSLTSSFWHWKLILAPIQTGWLRLLRNFRYGIIYSEEAALQTKNSNGNLFILNQHRSLSLLGWYSTYKSSFTGIPTDIFVIY
jgi:hypothetical protein